jgi:ketosteroid isomerase-like protein
MALAGQKGEGKKQPESPALPAQLLPLTPAQRINSLISHMLAAWQVGDVILLHRYYADDVTVVSGFNQPNIEGWRNYLAAYEAQRHRMRSCQIIRRNTFVTVHGDVAWASYQWQFGGLVDGYAVNFDGHTTLIFEHRQGSWLIVLNHTSLDAPAEPVAVPVRAPQTSAR